MNKEEYFYHDGAETLGQVSHRVIDAPSQETFKIRLEGSLSNLVFLKMSLITANGLD